MESRSCLLMVWPGLRLGRSGALRRAGARPRASHYFEVERIGQGEQCRSRRVRGFHREEAADRFGLHPRSTGQLGLAHAAGYATLVERSYERVSRLDPGSGRLVGAPIPGIVELTLEGALGTGPGGHAISVTNMLRRQVDRPSSDRTTTGCLWHGVRSKLPPGAC